MCTFSTPKNVPVRGLEHCVLPIYIALGNIVLKIPNMESLMMIVNCLMFNMTIEYFDLEFQ